LAGNRVTVGRVRRDQLRSVIEQAVPDEPDRAVEQVSAAGDRDGLAREALVPDPGVAVVVVASLLGPCLL
jgi:hypothetical protein